MCDFVHRTLEWVMEHIRGFSNESHYAEWIAWISVSVKVDYILQNLSLPGAPLYVIEALRMSRYYVQFVHEMPILYHYKSCRSSSVLPHGLHLGSFTEVTGIIFLSS